jgi:hypothetical protein
MYVPTNTTLIGTLTPVTSVDVSLHTFLDASWLVLLPYTVLGAALMVYSQGRLMRGQRLLKNEDVLVVHTSNVE